VLETMMVNWEYVSGGARHERHPARAEWPSSATTRRSSSSSWCCWPWAAVAVGVAHRALEGRPGVRRHPRQRGGGGVHGRADAAAEAAGDDGERRPDGIAGAPFPYYLTFVDPISEFNLSLRGQQSGDADGRRHQRRGFAAVDER